MQRLLFSTIVFAALTTGAWADHAIISYTRPDGGVAFLIPAPVCLRQLQRPVGIPAIPGECPALGLTAQQALEWVRDKDVPVGATNITIHDHTLLPERSKREAWRKSGAGFTIDPSIVREDAQGLRQSLAGIFAGTAAQKQARMLDVTEKYPPLSTALNLLRGKLTQDARGFILETVTRIKARIGLANEVLTQAEYDALKALATSRGLGGLIP